MKNENPALNISLLEARKIRDFLNAVGFIVSDIQCDPNIHGSRGATMVPERNIPDDGEAYNLVFHFDGTGPRAFHQVTRVRDVIVHPNVDSLRVLYRQIWPSGGMSDMDARLMTNAQIKRAVDRAINVIAFGEPVIPPAPAPKLSEPSANDDPVADPTRDAVVPIRGEAGADESGPTQ